MRLPRLNTSTFTVRQKIYFGFLIMVGLLVSLGLASMWSTYTYKKFLERYNTLNNRVNLQMDVALSVKEFQRQVTRFTNDGHRSAATDAQESMRVIRNRIGQTNTDGDSDDSLFLSKILIHLDDYDKTFQKVIKERNLYNQLIAEDIPRITSKLEETISRLQATQSNLLSHPEYRLNLLSIKADLLTYLETQDSRYTEEMKSHFDSLRKLLRNEGIQETDNHFKKILDDFKVQVDQLQYLSNRTIQATRGYLFLVNVVMAGEAAEIMYYTEKLQNSADAQLKTIRAELISLHERMGLLLFWLTIVPISIGSIYAIYIARQITIPLSLITDTLSTLGRGGRVTRIPGINRTDEIGELAQSANVFRQKNAETEDLLAHAELLTKELKANKEALEVSNEEMEHFVYTVSHDLKSPIVTSMGFISMIRELANTGNTEEAINRLDRVEEANKRMGTLINDLLDLSRAGRVDMEKSAIKSGHVLCDLVTRMENSITDSGFRVRLEGKFPIVMANESRFLQIFENLISNSLKYGRGYPPHENLIKITCESDEDRKLHIFNFRDYGQGIPEEYHEKVFTLFARLNKNSEGTGIGLTIVRKLTRYYGGNVWIAKTKETGTTICLSFPLAENLESSTG